MNQIYSGTRPLILFGGGLDSCAMVEFNHSFNPFLLYFDYGQKACVGERRALEHFARKYKLDYKVFEVPSVVPDSPLTSGEVVTDAAEHAKNYIPGRNLLLGALAFSFACAHKLSPIMLGASPAPSTSAFRDATLDFQRGFNSLTRIVYPNEETFLLLPLVTGDREQYLSRALASAPELFEIAFTCYESETTQECGVCVHCQQKRELAGKLNATWRR